MDKMLKIYSILEFLRPEYLKTSISLFSKNLIKKSWIVRSSINGNNSNIWTGEFKSDKKSVKPKPTFSFLKNSSSLSKFKINTSHN